MRRHPYGTLERFLFSPYTGVRPGHRRGEDNVLHADAPECRDSSIPRAVVDLLGLHSLHGGRELGAFSIIS